MAELSCSSSLVKVVTLGLQRLQQQSEVTTVEAGRQWALDYQQLCHTFQVLWSELALEGEESPLLAAELQQLCSSWWVFSFLTIPHAADGASACCLQSYLQAGQPLLLLSVPSNADEGQQSALQTAVRETRVVWRTMLDSFVKKTEERVSSSDSLLPPLRVSSELYLLQRLVAETALLLGGPHEVDAHEEPPTCQELLADLCQSLRSAYMRFLAHHVQRLFHGMIYPSFHPVGWQSERQLESAMTRVSGVHPCAWILFSLCRTCVTRAPATQLSCEPLAVIAALCVHEYCHAFVALIRECVASPSESWQDDPTRRHNFLTDVYVAVVLCRLLRNVYEPVDHLSARKPSLADTMTAVIEEVECMDRGCSLTSTDDSQMPAPPFSASDVWQSAMWSVAPLTLEQIRDATSQAPWTTSFAAASVINSLLDARGSLQTEN